MRRREALTLGVAALAGCSAAPSPPEHAESPPNVFLDDEWNGTRHEFTFAYGTTVTPRNTGSLAFYHEGTGERTVWVSQEADEDPEASFPLAPGASIALEADPGAEIRLIWEPPERGNSISLETFVVGSNGRDSA